MSKRWTDYEIAWLGTLPDPDVAVRLGRTLKSVQRKRTELSIAAYTERREWTPADDAILGTAPDPEIARRLGTTVKAVTCRRQLLKRPRYRRSTVATQPSGNPG